MSLKEWLMSQGLWENFVAEGGTESCQEVIDGFYLKDSKAGEIFWWDIQYKWEAYYENI